MRAQLDAGPGTFLFCAQIDTARTIQKHFRAYLEKKRSREGAEGQRGAGAVTGAGVDEGQAEQETVKAKMGSFGNVVAGLLSQQRKPLSRRQSTMAQARCVRVRASAHVHIHTHTHTYIHSSLHQSTMAQAWCVRVRASAHTHTHTHTRTHRHRRLFISPQWPRPGACACAQVHKFTHIHRRLFISPR